jgi:hypothetical protein
MDSLDRAELLSYFQELRGALNGLQQFDSDPDWTIDDLIELTIFHDRLLKLIRSIAAAKKL